MGVSGTHGWHFLSGVAPGLLYLEDRLRVQGLRPDRLLTSAPLKLTATPSAAVWTGASATRRIDLTQIAARWAVAAVDPVRRRIRAALDGSDR